MLLYVVFLQCLLIFITPSSLSLSFIDLTSLVALTEGALCAFFECCGAQLRTVYLSFCAHVTSRVAGAVALHCPLLEKLYLS